MQRSRRRMKCRRATKNGPVDNEVVNYKWIAFVTKQTKRQRLVLGFLFPRDLLSGRQSQLLYEQKTYSAALDLSGDLSCEE